MDMAPAMTIVIVPPKTATRGGWNSDASSRDGRDEANPDAWNSTPTEPNLLTNDFSLRRGWDSSAFSRLNERRSGFPFDRTQDAHLFDGQTEFDRSATRREEHLDRPFSDDSTRSFEVVSVNDVQPSRFIGAGTFQGRQI
jgi:hypothetical protein